MSFSLPLLLNPPSLHSMASLPSFPFLDLVCSVLVAIICLALEDRTFERGDEKKIFFFFELPLLLETKVSSRSNFPPQSFSFVSLLILAHTAMVESQRFSDLKNQIAF